MAEEIEKHSFEEQAEAVLSLEIAHRTGPAGGYGADGEVIYEEQPFSCPSVLVDSRKHAQASFMSNGSCGFTVTGDDGMEISVLRPHYDRFEKREIGVPSHNIWISPGRETYCSLINPSSGSHISPERVRCIKIGDPERAYWYCCEFDLNNGLRFDTAVRCGLTLTGAGPAVTRQVYIADRGPVPLAGSLWAFFNLRSTQLFVYNKEIWYDMGMPVTDLETVAAAVVPYTDIVQIKRISSSVSGGAEPGPSTCDYSDFIGHSGSMSIMPEAVCRGAMLERGAGDRLNRFSTPTVYAQEFRLEIEPGQSGCLEQSLLYVSDKAVAKQFRKNMQSETPAYTDMERAFNKASRELCGKTPGAKEITAFCRGRDTISAHPCFLYAVPQQPAVSEYANSVWTGVEELYEHCRAHGAVLAQGIELGTRDRAQDMWPEMKQDPGRVRQDLKHMFSFMYYHTDDTIDGSKDMTLTEKLHGMFPRQYPSRWTDRTEEIRNDNRPYADSALWPIDSLIMYIEETGDNAILLERVPTVRLTDPEHPVVSAMTGHDREFCIAEIVYEVLAAFERHACVSPYGMAQVMYGEWCDPVDMFGTNPVGDPETRGAGRGGNTRLSAHVFMNAVRTADLFRTEPVRAVLKDTVHDLDVRTERIRKFADRLRQDTVAWAWEESGPGRAGFIDYIHELNKDGSIPFYDAGEIGYTLGSMEGKDFDGQNRRILTAQAWGLRMISCERDYLKPVDGSGEMAASLLKTVDSLFYDSTLGLKLLSVPVANNGESLKYVGRMGVLPAGTAENGEYHHGQVMMHLFRLMLPGQADTVWKQFLPVMSAARGEDLNGPFETPSTSYASDPEDPHFGAGMYFGLSGSTDWIVEIFEKIAGLDLNLHNSAEPSVRVCPDLPRVLEQQLVYKRIIHYALDEGGYREIPFALNVERAGKKKKAGITVNGTSTERAEISDLEHIDRIDIEIIV